MPSIDINLLNKVDSIILVSIQYIGLVCNILMLVVFQGRNLRKLSVSTYIQCLAFFCACHNAFYLFSYYAPVNYPDKSEILCRLKGFFYLFLQPVSAWFEVVASFDRFLTILFPVKFGFFRKLKLKLFIIVLVVIMNAACYFSFLYDDQLHAVHMRDPSNSECVIFLEYEITLLDFFNGAAMPFVFMIAASIATFAGVRIAHKRVRSVGQDERSRRTRMRDIRFGVTLIVLNACFVLFNLPHRLNNIFVWIRVSLFDNYMIGVVFNRVCKELYETYYSAILLIQLIVNTHSSEKRIRNVVCACIPGF